MRRRATRYHIVDVWSNPYRYPDNSLRFQSILLLLLTFLLFCFICCETPCLFFFNLTSVLIGGYFENDWMRLRAGGGGYKKPIRNVFFVRFSQRETTRAQLLRNDTVFKLMKTRNIIEETLLTVCYYSECKYDRLSELLAMLTNIAMRPVLMFEARQRILWKLERVLELVKQLEMSILQRDGPVVTQLKWTKISIILEVAIESEQRANKEFLNR